MIQRSLRVLYFPIHNPDYPRNRLIRGFMRSSGWPVVAIDRGHSANERATWRARLAAVVGLWRDSRDIDVVVLSEMSIKYSILTWAIARSRHATHVVDGFIGLYETQVLDMRHYRVGSVRAWLCHLVDRLAVLLADVYLTDTEVRAQRILTLARRRTAVISIPVGAPNWATPMTPIALDSRLRVLFYGNFAPLNGVRTILEAVAIAAADRSLEVVLVGDGPEFGLAESLIGELGIADICHLVPRVREDELRSLIEQSNLVLGIFGTSLKAETVIPNKVWQALACGRPVVTRVSDALSEISKIAGDQLITVAPGDSRALASTLLSFEPAKQVIHPGVAERLAEYVEDKLEGLLEVIIRKSNENARR